MSENKAPTVPDVFRGFRLGIVTIFGVLLPGVWFWASTTFFFMSLWGLEGQASVFAPLKSISFPQPVLWIFGFVLVYVAGSQLRAMSPNPIDRLSICWRHLMHRAWLIERGDRFPYESLPRYFRHQNMTGFAEFVPWSRETSRGACSTLFVNYSKLCVASRDRQMGDFLDQEEAFIRAMSGVAWGTIASTMIGIVFVVWVFFVPHAPSWTLFIFTLATNMAVFVAIVMNFHRQRLRELSKLIGALYVMFRDYDGSHPPYGGCDNG